MSFALVIRQLAEKPGNLFLIDGAGALLSALLLGLVLPALESFFGMPRDALFVLAFFPCLFLFYDLVVYFKSPPNHGPFIKGIALANLSYCLISLGLVIHHFQVLTIFGLVYFCSEIALVIMLAVIELMVAMR